MNGKGVRACVHSARTKEPGGRGGGGERRRLQVLGDHQRSPYYAGVKRRMDFGVDWRMLLLSIILAMSLVISIAYTIAVAFLRSLPHKPRKQPGKLPHRRQQGALYHTSPVKLRDLGSDSLYDA